jgi:hypothetical protein
VTWNLRLPAIINGPEKATELDQSIMTIEHAVRLIAVSNTADDVRTAIAPLRPASTYPHI